MKKFIRSIPGKVTMFLALNLALLLLAACVAGAVFTVGYSLYDVSEREAFADLRGHNVMQNVAFAVQLHEMGADSAELFPDFYEYRITKSDGSVALESAGFAAVDGDADREKTYDSYSARLYVFRGASGETYSTFNEEPLINGITDTGSELVGTYDVVIHVKEDAYHNWEEKAAAEVLSFTYRFRSFFIPGACAALLLSIILFIAMMCAAGHRPDREEVVPGTFAKVPFDVIFIVGGLLCFGGLWFFSIVPDPPFNLILAGAWCVVALNLVLGMCMNFATRVKLGTLINTSLLYYLCRWIFRAIRATFRFFGRCLRPIVRAFASIPTLWKVILVIPGISFAEFAAFVILWEEQDILLFCWAIEKLITVPLIIVIADNMRRVEKLGRTVAAGDLSAQVDCSGMFPAFRRHAQDLGSISEGMARSVDKQMKSERMKTELITNVSHDIKTPLTSIINYSDLITREESDNEKITEYAAVLLRQSEKLKRLIEDLVEASKAATGNLEVEPAPCDASVFVSQVGGEFEDRLASSGLELVTRLPDYDVRIMADSRRMWRVFDNLMNNICKYSQPGTRVYLTLECIGARAVFTFRNTSREPLNISADELMERFVRGDASRNTEGNGLGLSIAKSLTELQNGTLSLHIDGDLFKVILSFPALKDEAPAQLA